MGRFQKVVPLYVLVLWVAGCSDTIDPGFVADSQTLSPAKTVVAERVERTEWCKAVGTIRPRTESRMESRITGQVLEVVVQAGARVAKGDLLLRLDDRQARSRLDQAKEALHGATAAKKQAVQSVAAAKAGFQQAESDWKRVRQFFQEGAATQREKEQAASRYQQAMANEKRATEALRGADAGIRQAREIVKEAGIALGYTRITAPEAGEVLQRLVEPGDLAVPGKPLLVLKTSGGLRLEAHVREGLMGTVGPGKALFVAIDTRNLLLPCVVEEVVPYADPRSRTFLVKVTLPEGNGLYPGMFGTLRIPVGKRPAVVVDGAAVRRVGQLDLMTVETEGGWERRYVTCGEMVAGRREILSGLDGGERVAVFSPEEGR